MKNKIFRLFIVILGVVLTINSFYLISVSSKPLEKDINIAEQDENNNDFDYFKLKNARISPVIVYETKGIYVTKTFIGLMSTQRITEAEEELNITENDDWAEKVLSSRFKPIFFLQREENDNLTKEILDSFYTKKFWDTIIVDGTKITTDLDMSSPVSDMLKIHYKDKLPIIIQENQGPGETRFLGIFLLIVGLLAIIAPIVYTYRKVMLNRKVQNILND